MKTTNFEPVFFHSYDTSVSKRNGNECESNVEQIFVQVISELIWD